MQGMGPPEKIYTENGDEFMADCERLCEQEAGPKRAAPHSPWMNWVVEQKNHAIQIVTKKLEQDTDLTGRSTAEELMEVVTMALNS